MIFSTYWFLLFSACFFPLYWLVRAPWLRLGALLLGCTLFHAQFAGAAGMLPIIVLSLTTYAAGLWRNKWALRLGMALPVLALAFYKYTHFLSLNILGALSPELGAQADKLALAHMPATPPLAVSFFAFEFVHYLYDVGKGQPSIRNPAHFWAFTFFFPSLVAGPIKRYQQFIGSLKEGLARVVPDDIKVGLARIALGFFKKVVIADNLTAALEHYHGQYGSLGVGERWLFLVALGLRILMDFAGYSDIAIGLARLMGIRIPENFDWPYLATSVQDFWRRWHISLSSWIRDYVYVPLGGNRHGLPRKIANGLLAFALCGLWHGPAWNFVLWGVYHGVGLAISANYATLLGRPGRWLASALARAPYLGWAATLLFVLFGWLLFFYPVGEAWHLFKLLFVKAA